MSDNVLGQRAHGRLPSLPSSTTNEADPHGPLTDSLTAVLPGHRKSLFWDTHDLWRASALTPLLRAAVSRDTGVSSSVTLEEGGSEQWLFSQRGVAGAHTPL